MSHYFWTCSGNLLNVITDFLYQRKQKIVLNGQNSSWTIAETGVPKGSIFGPLFFLIYINDLSDGSTSNPKLFADDPSVLRCWKYKLNSKRSEQWFNEIKD